MIKIKQTGKFSKTEKYLKYVTSAINQDLLERYGREGVNALASSTPIDSGLTSESWYYELNKSKTSVTISFHNSNIQNGVPIAIVLQYGHGTRNGGWVQGRDYINPAIQPIFDKIANQAWKEVTKT